MIVKDGRGKTVRILSYSDRYVYYTWALDEGRIERCSGLQYALDNWTAELQAGEERFEEIGRQGRIRHAIFSTPPRGAARGDTRRRAW